MCLTASLAIVLKSELNERDWGCCSVGSMLDWYASYPGFHSQHCINKCSDTCLSPQHVGHMPVTPAHERGDRRMFIVIFRYTESVRQVKSRDLDFIIIISDLQ